MEKIDKKNFLTSLLNKNSDVDLKSYIDLQFLNLNNFLGLDNKGNIKENLHETKLHQLLKDSILFETSDFKITFNSYTIRKQDLSDNHYITYEQTLQAEIIGDITVENKILNTVENEKITLFYIPIMTNRYTFIINGIERGFILQFLKINGVYFLQEVNKQLNTKEFVLNFRPKKGQFFNASLSQHNIKKNKGIFIYLHKIKIPWFLFTTVLFYDNIWNMLLDFFNNNTIDWKRRKINSTHFLLLDFNIIKKYIEKFPNHGFKKVIDLNNHIILNDSSFIDNKDRLLLIENENVIFLNNLEVVYIETLFDNVSIAKFLYNRMKNTVILNYALELLKEMFLTHDQYLKEDNLTTYVICKKFNLKVEDLDLKTILKHGLFYLKNLYYNKSGYEIDNMFDMKNRYVKDVVEVLQQTISNHMYNLNIGSIKSYKKKDNKINILHLLSFKLLNHEITKIFTQHSSSQFLDQLNPLSEILHKTKLTTIGEDGLIGEFANIQLRNITASSYNKLCCITTPEGKNVGLILYFAMYAKIDKYGFLYSPYYIVQDGIVNTTKVVYINLFDENQYQLNISQYTDKIDNNGKLIDEYVICKRNEELVKVHKNDIDLKEVYKDQFISINSSLIPFLEHNDNTRANMASNMQRQAINILKNQQPMILTGNEEKIVNLSRYIERAKYDGTIIESDNQKVVIKYDNNSIETINVTPVQLGNQKTPIIMNVVVKKGDIVKPNDIIFESSSSKEGILSLGTNLLVGVLPFYGTNFEDATILSERCVKEQTLSNFNYIEIKTEIVHDKKIQELVTKNLPGYRDEQLQHLDEEGIVKIGSYVTSDMILVGKITNTGLQSQSNKLMSAVLGSIIKSKNSSLKVPKYISGVVTNIVRFNTSTSTEKKEVLKIRILSLSNIKVGDKLCGRYGDKRIISKIAPEIDMPYLEDGRRLDLIINPLGILSRMNIGQLMELNLTSVMNKKGEKQRTIQLYDNLTVDDIQKEMVDCGIGEEGKFTLYNGITGEKFHNPATVGYMYVLKLEHMVEKKIHARSIGPYSALTKQPVGSRVKEGGQRTGYMELWAYLGYGAANIIQEKTVLLSDDTESRENLIEDIIFNNSNKCDYKLNSNTFNMLIKYLQALNIDVRLEYKVEEEKNE